MQFPAQRILYGFASITLAAAISVILGFGIDPNELKPEFVVLVAKWQAGLILLGGVLIATGVDAAEKAYYKLLNKED